MKLKPLAFLIIATLAFLSSFSQPDSTAQNREPKFYLAGYWGAFSLHSIKTDLINPKIGFSLPLSFYRRFSIGEKFEIATGITGRMITSRLKDYSVTFPSDIDELTGVDYYNSWQKVTSRNYYAGVPVSFRYIISKTGKLHYLGLNCDFLYATHNTAKMKIFENGNKTKTVKTKYSQDYFFIIPRAELTYRFKTGKWQFYGWLYAEKALNKMRIEYLSPSGLQYLNPLIFGISLHGMPKKRK